MIEHFLMWLDLMPSLNHTSEIIIYAFLIERLTSGTLYVKYSLTKVRNYMGSSKSYVKNH
jgi:hypothetical protein